jgi:hypothetical protein
MPVAADDLQLAANTRVGVLTFVRKLGRGKLAPRGHRLHAKAEVPTR